MTSHPSDESTGVPQRTQYAPSNYDVGVPQKLPDEFFRRRPEQPEAAPTSSKDSGAPRESVQGPKSRRAKAVMVPMRVAAVLIFTALVVGFLVGRQLFRQGDAARPAPPVAPASGPSSPRATPSSGLALYEGPTRAVSPTNASSTCPESDPGALIDSVQATTWRCAGDSVGERIEFRFPGQQELVGLRIASGDKHDLEATLSERQILSLRWRLSDGSWFEQGLAGVNGASQEIAFPPVVVQGLELEILQTTHAEGPDDALTIGEIEFLARG